MLSSSLCSHALVLDAQGFGAFWNTKANRHKIKIEPVGNDRSPQANDYVKELGQCHILIRGLTRRISLRTSEPSLPGTASPNETVPVNTGHCPRLLPFPQGMTVEWLACVSTQAADRLKSKYHVEKENFQAKSIFHFRWFGSYNMRKISQKSIPNSILCSRDLLSPWRCKALDPFEKQSRTETK